MANKCPKCSAEYFEILRFCPDCGFDFSSGVKKCPKCRAMVPVNSGICHECGLDFEKYSFLVPRIIVFGLLGLILIFIIFTPWFWQKSPWLHDKGVISEGLLRSSVEGISMIPMFLEWQSGERYIELSRRESMGSTEYMDQLIPLPPAVVFHYDINVSEKVWIIRRVSHGENTWLLIGRFRANRHDKYGWIHASNLSVVD